MATSEELQEFRQNYAEFLNVVSRQKSRINEMLRDGRLTPTTWQDVDLEERSFFPLWPTRSDYQQPDTASWLADDKGGEIIGVPLSELCGPSPGFSAISGTVCSSRDPSLRTARLKHIKGLTARTLADALDFAGEEVPQPEPPPTPPDPDTAPDQDDAEVDDTTTQETDEPAPEETDTDDQAATDTGGSGGSSGGSDVEPTDGTTAEAVESTFTVDNWTVALVLVAALGLYVAHQRGLL